MFPFISKSCFISTNTNFDNIKSECIIAVFSHCSIQSTFVVVLVLSDTLMFCPASFWIVGLSNIHFAVLDIGDFVYVSHMENCKSWHGIACYPLRDRRVSYEAYSCICLI